MSLTSAPVVPCSCAEGWKPEGWAYCAECYEGKIERLRAALAPFAAVAESDIGQDETDADIFQPMRSGYNREPLITVGDMRRAASALTRPDRGGSSD